jgi:hypothetical protein
MFKEHEIVKPKGYAEDLERVQKLQAEYDKVKGGRDEVIKQWAVSEGLDSAVQSKAKADEAAELKKIGELGKELEAQMAANKAEYEKKKAESAVKGKAADAGAGSAAPAPAPSGDHDAKWRQIPGGLKQVSVSGNNVCGVNSADDIYCKDNLTGGNWRKVPGKLKQVSVHGNGVYGVNSANNIYYSPNLNGSWRQIPGGLKQVSTHGNNVCGVNSADDIYCKDNLTDGNWRKVPGKLKQVSVHGNGVYGVNSANNIYYSPNLNGSWRQIPGKLKHVSTSGNQVCGVNSADDIYCKNNLTGGNWRKVGGKLKQVSLSGNTLYGVNSADNIFLGSASSVASQVRYVKLVHTNVNQVINLAELEVFDTGGNNVASRKVVSSSAFHPAGPLPFLVDGNKKNFAHSMNEIPNVMDSMTIDLGGLHDIQRIVITNRVDCCQDRAIGIKAVLQGVGNVDIMETPPIQTNKPVYTFTMSDGVWR